MSRARRSLDFYLAGVTSRNRAVLAQAITLVESELPAAVALAEQLLDRLPPAPQSFRIGITGIPGAGKSTFIEALGTALLRKEHASVAVLAIDPSSAVSGGSILGDKTRMPTLSLSESAFVRPSPARGALGGIAKGTRAAIRILEAAGYSYVLVETVGVGQSELEVSQLVDFVVLLMVTGTGDQLQGMKRGVLEVSDLIAINKADGPNVALANETRQEVESVLALFPPMTGGWRPPVLTCSAVSGIGISDIIAAIESYASEYPVAQRRREQERHGFEQLVNAGLRARLWQRPQAHEQFDRLALEVTAGRKSANEAAKEWLNAVLPLNVSSAGDQP